MRGRVIAVVGPSGVGKDTVMAALHAALPHTYLVRRVITRPVDAGGEDHDAVSEAEFDALARNGAFAVHWRAHGLHYGIPTTIKYQLGLGKDCLVNFSRRALREAARVFPELVVLNVTASPDTVAERLVSRNRESRADIRKRLAEAQKELPPGLDVRTLPNDGPVSDTVARAILLLGPRGDAGPMDRHRETQGRPESESIQ